MNWLSATEVQYIYYYGSYTDAWLHVSWLVNKFKRKFSAITKSNGRCQLVRPTPTIKGNKDIWQSEIKEGDKGRE